MGQTDATRVETNENENTLKSADLASGLTELDSRVTGKDLYPVITRTLGYITKIEYFGDIAHTIKLFQREFTRTTGSDLVEYITGVVSTFYNDGGSTDSIITTVLTRNATDQVTSCSNAFSTTEPQC